MNLIEKTIDCPYCGESLDVLIDETDIGQSYIEDCQVCCRPIVFSITASSDCETTVSVQAENE